MGGLKELMRLKMGWQKELMLLEDRVRGWFIERMAAHDRTESRIMGKLDQMQVMINNIDECTDKMKASIDILAQNANEHPAHCFSCGKPLGIDNRISYLGSHICTECAKSKEHDRRDAPKEARFGPPPDTINVGGKEYVVKK